MQNNSVHFSIRCVHPAYVYFLQYHEMNGLRVYVYVSVSGSSSYSGNTENNKKFWQKIEDGFVMCNSNNKQNRSHGEVSGYRQQHSLYDSYIFAVFVISLCVL
jgi:hypothetical protein